MTATQRACGDQSRRWAEQGKVGDFLMRTLFTGASNAVLAHPHGASKAARDAWTVDLR